MKIVVGILLILLGIVLGLYVGGYVLFIGGLVQFFTAMKILFVSGIAALDVMAIVMGIVKILVAGAVGWLTFIFCAIVGTTIKPNILP